MSRRLSLTQLLLVAIALTAIVGHVCVLPGYTHAAPAAGAHADEQPAHDHGPADAAHAASCEALRPGSSSSAPVLVVDVVPIPTLPTMGANIIERSSNTPSPRSARPLYLTHRSLLI
jgi:hypothetical protein